MDAGELDRALEDAHVLEPRAPRGRRVRRLDNDVAEREMAQGQKGRPLADHHRVEAELLQGGGAWPGDGGRRVADRRDLQVERRRRQVDGPLVPREAAESGDGDADPARVGERDDEPGVAPHAGVDDVVLDREGDPEGVDPGSGPLLPAAEASYFRFSHSLMQKINYVCLT